MTIESLIQIREQSRARHRYRRSLVVNVIRVDTLLELYLIQSMLHGVHVTQMSLCLTGLHLLSTDCIVDSLNFTGCLVLSLIDAVGVVSSIVYSHVGGGI